MLWVYVGEPLWAHTMKYHFRETSARIDAILSQLPAEQADEISTASARLATFSPFPSFNLETMFYVDAANAFKKVDAKFGRGASEITNGFAFVIGWKDESFGLLSDKKAVSLFWNFPGTDAYSSVIRHLNSAGGRRVFREDATAAIVAYRPRPPIPGDNVDGQGQHGDGDNAALKEFWTTSITGNLDSKAMENLMGGAPCRGPNGGGHGARDLPARIWPPSDGNCAAPVRDDSQKYVPTGEPMCYWNWQRDMCGKSRLLEMTLFLRDVCKVAITRVVGIELFSLEWPACFRQLQERSKRATNHGDHGTWKQDTKFACKEVIRMAHPNKRFDLNTRSFGRNWAASTRGGIPMLQCPNAKIEDGGCKELKQTLNLAFYKVPAAPLPAVGADAAVAPGAAVAAGAADNAGTAAAAVNTAADACDGGDDDDEDDDNPPHNVATTDEGDAENLSRNGYVYIEQQTHGYRIVLPSPENALKINEYFAAYIAHNRVLQVPVADRRAEALYTCTRAKQTYKDKLSALENDVNSAPTGSKEQKAAKRKLERKLSDMKRNGVGVGLEEMVALYDLEKNSERCRYVMDDNGILEGLVAGARRVVEHDLSADANAMEVGLAIFNTERTKLRQLVPQTRGNYLKKATCGIGKELFHNLRNPVLFSDLLFGDETFSEKKRALVDGSMHASFRCPGSSWLGRAIPKDARMYDKQCKVTDGVTRYSKLKANVKTVCGLETGISLGGHKDDHHIKRLSGHGFRKCIQEWDSGSHYHPESKCLTYPVAADRGNV